MFPFISVIMPVRNEAGFIQMSLGAVLAQAYPHDRMEVILADGMSTDSTRQIIGEMASKTDIAVTVLDNPGKIVPTGMNRAIREAKGDIIVRIDGHTIVESDYVRECVSALERSGAANAGGPMRAVGEGYLSEAVSLATSTPFGIGNSVFHYSDREQYVDTVYMGAFRKDVLFKAGLFDESYQRHQDYELNYRIRKAGGKIFLTPRIRSIYHVRSSLGRLWKQYFQYGVWKGRFVRLHPDSLKWRHMVPPVFVLSLVFALAGGVVTKVGGWAFGGLGALYGGFLLIATVIACKRGGWRYLPLLPVIFACLHFSWGTGVWIGAGSGIPRKRQSNQSYFG